MDKVDLFSSLNQLFDKIYVITLKRSTDRHKLLDHNLQGLEYEKFWGVDGNKLTYEDKFVQKKYHSGLTRLLDKKRGKCGDDLTLNNIACSLSHANVYSDIIKNKYKSSLILEDDIMFDYSAGERLIKGLSELPDDWDLLYLGYWANTHPMSYKEKFKTMLLLQASKYLYKYDYNQIKWRYPESYSNNLDISGKHYGAHGYALSLTGAKKILDFKMPITLNNDNLIGELCNLRWINAFNLKKKVFYQNYKLDSNITSSLDHRFDIAPPEIIKEWNQ